MQQIRSGRGVKTVLIKVMRVAGGRPPVTCYDLRLTRWGSSTLRWRARETFRLWPKRKPLLVHVPPARQRGFIRVDRYNVRSPKVSGCTSMSQVEASYRTHSLAHYPPRYFDSAVCNPCPFVILASSDIWLMSCAFIKQASPLFKRA